MDNIRPELKKQYNDEMKALVEQQLDNTLKDLKYPKDVRCGDMFYRCSIVFNLLFPLKPAHTREKINWVNFWRRLEKSSRQN